MSLERYEFDSSNDFLNHEFESAGPNGKIKKLVRFSLRNANGKTYFNLGFGDLNIDTGRVSDLSISDNQDTQKVLATVAAIVLTVLEQYPDIAVYARGSTEARTRLYQRAIAGNVEEVTKSLDLFGFINGQWQGFSKNVNYEAFLAVRRKP